MSKVVALVGATASGKSDAAHRAALAHSMTEIVSLDAMSVYRGMDLGTAKPTHAQRDEVRYHLLDVLDPSEELTVRRFQAMCTEALAEIAARGHTALLVGGSGLYHRAVVDELSIPPHDERVRAELEAFAAGPGGPAALFAELEAIDPLAASRTSPHNVRRTIRALEVVRLTGRPFSSFGAGLARYPESEVAQVGITFDAARTDVAIEQRFKQWMADGLLDELRALDASPGLSRTARQAAGYRQLIDHLDGNTGLDEAVDRALAATRRLARRQWRWFRRDPRVTWADDSDGARVLVERAL